MEKPRLIELPRIEDKRGNLSFFQEKMHFPFEIERVYWVYDVPNGQIRGGHAYHELSEIIIALSGSFDVLVDYGDTTQKFTLNRSNTALYIPPKLWRHLENFSTNSICLVAASRAYEASDYIRDYASYLKMKQT
jgi:dTDP-4-dehydrorhamnose 3,5-epimerase-like enzyme